MFPAQDRLDEKVSHEDIYSMIYPVKEKQFLRFGNFRGEDYYLKMDALKKGNLQMILPNKIFRNILRAMLSIQGGVRFVGKNNYDNHAVVFTDNIMNHLNEKLYRLKNFCGLTEVFPSGNNYFWYFESEFVMNGKRLEFQENPELRKALTKMLSFYNDECFYLLPKN
jgi:hypothetical protein